MKKFSVVLFSLFFSWTFRNEALAQVSQNLKCFSDSSLQKEGQCWPSEAAAGFDRLPLRAKEVVPPRVWELSRQPAGEMIRFTTKAEKIVVRYTVTQNLSMPHMPATGVSGVDLYAIDEHGKQYWVPGKFSFKDTIEYVFNNIRQLPDQVVFQLYLPLYNRPRWLRIGVPQVASIQFFPPRAKPIVVYGTSIVQGGCASRPGLAWTAVLGRRLNLPVVNLGFSGSGKMEASVIDLIAEIQARLFILDCMPNLTRGYRLADSVIENRYTEAVKKIRAIHPEIPILLAEHSGGSAPGYLDRVRSEDYRLSSVLLDSIYQGLKSKGVANIFLITSEQFGFDLESTVDGLHPNDAGMMRYAEAYEQVVRSILSRSHPK